MYQERSLANWPIALLGIAWAGTDDVGPPTNLVVGRMTSKAWIVGVIPNFDSDQLEVVIGWDETSVDPLSCRLAVRSEANGLLILDHELRISDFPRGDATADHEPRIGPLLQDARERLRNRAQVAVVGIGPAEVADERLAQQAPWEGPAVIERFTGIE